MNDSACDKRAMAAVRDAIRAQRPGFAGDFVSSKYLRDLLPGGGGRLKTLMAAMGYVRHPALERNTNNAVMPDNCRVTLYVRRGSDAHKIERPVSVERAYEKAQAASFLADATLAAPSPPEPESQFNPLLAEALDAVIAANEALIAGRPTARHVNAAKALLDRFARSDSHRGNIAGVVAGTTGSL